MSKLEQGNDNVEETNNRVVSCCGTAVKTRAVVILLDAASRATPEHKGTHIRRGVYWPQ
jgi:hypothetical protein